MSKEKITTKEKTNEKVKQVKKSTYSKKKKIKKILLVELHMFNQLLITLLFP